MFEVDPVEKKRPQGRPAAVDKTFRAFDPHQVLLLPPSLDEWLPEDHLARFVAELVDEVLDLGPVLADYTEKRGYPPYDPRLMVRLLIYGYTTGIRSSRAIERKCADDVAFRFLAADQAPDLATGRLKHEEQVPPAPRGRIPKDATLKERMARKLRTKPGKAAYSRRKAIVEPVFGQIMTCQNGRRLLMRGENGARGEWRLLAACHNLRKIFRHAGTAGLTALTG
ncbi:transposase [Streptomyces sp. NPDC005708]|uniref:transposase n=1 Tax=Streptomyces sp. NPDC005708 TaxID=3154564 RepID=UPI0033F35CAF